MNRCFSIVLLAFVTAGIALAQTYRAPRTPDGKPDLNGIWQVLNTANWDLEAHGGAPGALFQLGAQGAVPPGLGVIEGDAIPYLPEAAAKKKENFAHRLDLDPEVRCYLPGVPRATYMPYPFQIVQSEKYLLFAYQYAGATRNINLGAAKKAPIDSWMGWSNGHWEGDTLVIEVTGLNDQTWLDRAGNFHSDALHVVERYTPRSPETMLYEATIEDPKTFSRPWKMSMLLYRVQDANAQLLEFKCVEFVEELMYGHLRKKGIK
jgi:hypothetical protein